MPRAAESRVHLGQAREESQRPDRQRTLANAEGAIMDEASKNTNIIVQLLGGVAVYALIGLGYAVVDYTLDERLKRRRKK